MELKNTTKLIFKNISTESYRVYVFAGNEIVTIQHPQWIHVGENGHRILDGGGVSHYVPKGWIHLYWVSLPDAPHFSL